MESSDHLQIDAVPELREPVVLAAFAGWNDASQVATYSVTTLIRLWSARAFARIDPESFFDFSETRPLISLDSAGSRSLEWPQNQFFSHRMGGSTRDVILLLGTEPNLRWRTFCRAVLKVAHAADASCLITLGGLLADVPHTLEPRLTGFASHPRLLPQMQQLGIQMSSYEGPTGIVGALHDAWHQTGRPAMSLWANVPHYISATPNPVVSLALLRRVSALLRVPLSLSSVELQAKAFRTQVDEALQENPEAQDYVQQLEEQYGSAPGPPPDAPALIEALEEFLRTGRPPEDEPPDVAG